jgi:hypothetical protein
MTRGHLEGPALKAKQAKQNDPGCCSRRDCHRRDRDRHLSAAIERLVRDEQKVPVPKITPANPTFRYPGQQVTLTANYSTCTWSVSNIALIIRSSTGSSVTVENTGPAWSMTSSTVTAKCPVWIGNGSTTLQASVTIPIWHYAGGL